MFTRWANVSDTSDNVSDTSDNVSDTSNTKLFHDIIWFGLFIFIIDIMLYIMSLISITRLLCILGHFWWWQAYICMMFTFMLIELLVALCCCLCYSVDRMSFVVWVYKKLFDSKYEYSF